VPRRTTGIPADAAVATGPRRSSGPTRSPARSNQLLLNTEGIANFNTVAGFSLLSRVTADNYGFYFIGLKPWEERTRADLDARQIVNRVNAETAPNRAGSDAFAVMPPSIPGLGTQGGFSFWLQDRTGGKSWVPEPEPADVPRRRQKAGRS